MGAGVGEDRRLGGRADYFRKQTGIVRLHSLAFSRQIGIVGLRAYDDPAGAALDRQGEGAGVRGARGEHDLIARLRIVERRLKISTRRDVDGCPRWRTVWGIEQLRQRGVCRARRRRGRRWWRGRTVIGYGGLALGAPNDHQPNEHTIEQTTWCHAGTPEKELVLIDIPVVGSVCSHASSTNRYQSC